MDMEPLTIPIAQMSSTIGPKYETYLTGRIFEILKDVRPWGMNGESMKWLLMDRLVEEEVSKELPAPDPDDVEAIMKKYWNMEAVRSQQRKDELSSFELNTKDEKPSRRIVTCGNGLLGLRTFADVGATDDVLRGVGELLKERVESAAAGTPRFKKIVQAKIAESPGFKDKNAVISSARIKEERQAVTKELYAYEEAVTPDRWNWLKDKQDELRKMEGAADLTKELFYGGDREKATSGKPQPPAYDVKPVVPGTSSRASSAFKAPEISDRKPVERKSEKRVVDEVVETMSTRKTRAKK